MARPNSAAAHGDVDTLRRVTVETTWRHADRRPTPSSGRSRTARRADRASSARQDVARAGRRARRLLRVSPSRRRTLPGPRGSPSSASGGFAAAQAVLAWPSKQADSLPGVASERDLFANFERMRRQMDELFDRRARAAAPRRLLARRRRLLHGRPAAGGRARRPRRASTRARSSSRSAAASSCWPATAAPRAARSASTSSSRSSTGRSGASSRSASTSTPTPPAPPTRTGC